MIIDRRPPLFRNNIYLFVFFLLFSICDAANFTSTYQLSEFHCFHNFFLIFTSLIYYHITAYVYDFRFFCIIILLLLIFVYYLCGAQTFASFFFFPYSNKWYVTLLLLYMCRLCLFDCVVYKNETLFPTNNFSIRF